MIIHRVFIITARDKQGATVGLRLFLCSCVSDKAPPAA